MARYRGPQVKLSRREGVALTDKCARYLERRSYPPGEHGRGRIRQSEYLLQLREKQKTRRFYGVLEKQFRRYYEKASRQPGITGENLLRMLELRLDNVVFRLGFAATRRQARQLVNHGHIMVNDQVVDIPSYQLRSGDVIAVRPRSRNLEVIRESLQRSRRSFPWLEVDRKAMQGKFLDYPNREDIPENIREHLIVELYSK